MQVTNRIVAKQMVANRILEGLKKKGWNKLRFAQEMHKSPSIITRWVSGTHNFTVNTIWEIERILEVTIVDLT